MKKHYLYLHIDANFLYLYAILACLFTLNNLSSAYFYVRLSLKPPSPLPPQSRSLLGNFIALPSGLALFTPLILFYLNPA
jgi:hypothetical protein